MVFAGMGSSKYSLANKFCIEPFLSLGFINEVKATNAAIVLADGPAFEKASSFKDISGNLGKGVWAVRKARRDFILKSPQNMLEPLPRATDSALESARSGLSNRSTTVEDSSMEEAMRTVLSRVLQPGKKPSLSRRAAAPAVCELLTSDSSDDDSNGHSAIFKPLQPSPPSALPPGRKMVYEILSDSSDDDVLDSPALGT